MQVILDWVVGCLYLLLFFQNFQPYFQHNCFIIFLLIMKIIHAHTLNFVKYRKLQRRNGKKIAYNLPQGVTTLKMLFIHLFNQHIFIEYSACMSTQTKRQGTHVYTSVYTSRHFSIHTLSCRFCKIVIILVKK